MIRSQPYTVPRPVLSRLTALYYLRTFWFVLIGPFLFGIGLLLLGPNQTARIFGMILVIWPMTVFTRAFLLVRKSADSWAKPTVMTVGEDAFLFEPESGDGKRYKLRFESVRRVIPMLGYQLLQTKRLGFVMVPDAALPDGVNLRTFVKPLEAG